MLRNQRYYIITTFRKDLDFDANYYNLLEERLMLKIDHKIDSEIVSGKFNGITEFSLLIKFSLNAKKQVRRIMRDYFQKYYLDITNCDAYFIDKDGLVLSHILWLEVDREEAINNIDFIYQAIQDKFYIAK